MRPPAALVRLAAIGAVASMFVPSASAQTSGLAPIHVYLSVWTVDDLRVDPPAARAAVEPAITRALHGWGACYARAAHENTHLAGTLHVRFSADRIGDPVGEAAVTGLPAAPDVAPCVASTITHGRFVHHTPTAVTVTLDVRVQYEAPSN